MAAANDDDDRMPALTPPRSPSVASPRLDTTSDEDDDMDVDPRATEHYVASSSAAADAVAAPSRAPVAADTELLAVWSSAMAAIRVGSERRTHATLRDTANQTHSLVADVADVERAVADCARHALALDFKRTYAAPLVLDLVCVQCTSGVRHTIRDMADPILRRIVELVNTNRCTPSCGMSDVYVLKTGGSCSFQYRGMVAVSPVASATLVAHVREAIEADDQLAAAYQVHGPALWLLKGYQDRYGHVWHQHHYSGNGTSSSLAAVLKQPLYEVRDLIVSDAIIGGDQAPDETQHMLLGTFQSTATGSKDIPHHDDDGMSTRIYVKRNTRPVLAQARPQVKESIDREARRTGSFVMAQGHGDTTNNAICQYVNEHTDTCSAEQVRDTCLHATASILAGSTTDKQCVCGTRDAVLRQLVSLGIGVAREVYSVPSFTTSMSPSHALTYVLNLLTSRLCNNAFHVMMVCVFRCVSRIRGGPPETFDSCAYCTTHGRNAAEQQEQIKVVVVRVLDELVTRVPTLLVNDYCTAIARAQLRSSLNHLEYVQCLGYMQEVYNTESELAKWYDELCFQARLEHVHDNDLIQMFITAMLDDESGREFEDVRRHHMLQMCHRLAPALRTKASVMLNQEHVGVTSYSYNNVDQLRKACSNVLMTKMTRVLTVVKKQRERNAATAASTGDPQQGTRAKRPRGPAMSSVVGDIINEYVEQLWERPADYKNTPMPNMYDSFLNTCLGVFNTVTMQYMAPNTRLLFNKSQDMVATAPASHVSVTVANVTRCLSYELTQSPIARADIRRFAINDGVQRTLPNHTRAISVMHDQQQDILFATVVVPGCLSLDRSVYDLDSANRVVKKLWRSIVECPEQVSVFATAYMGMWPVFVRYRELLTPERLCDAMHVLHCLDPDAMRLAGTSTVQALAHKTDVHRVDLNKLIDYRPQPAADDKPPSPLTVADLATYAALTQRLQLYRDEQAATKQYAFDTVNPCVAVLAAICVLLAAYASQDMGRVALRLPAAEDVSLHSAGGTDDDGTEPLGFIVNETTRRSAVDMLRAPAASLKRTAMRTYLQMHQVDTSLLSMYDLDLMQCLSDMLGFHGMKVRDCMRLLSAPLCSPKLRKSLLILYGQPNTGKSRLCTLMQSVFHGSVHCSSTILAAQGTASNGAAPETIAMCQVKLGVLSEVPRMDMTTLKMVTGNDMATCRPLYSGEFLECYPLVSLMSTCNAAPILDGADEAVRDRLSPIKCGTTFLAPDSGGVGRDHNPLLLWSNGCSTGASSWVSSVKLVAASLANSLLSTMISCRAMDTGLVGQPRISNSESKALVTRIMQASSHLYKIMHEANVQIRPDSMTSLQDLLAALLGQLEVHNVTRRACSKKNIDAIELIETFSNNFIGHFTDDRVWVRNLCIVGTNGRADLANSDMNVVDNLLERVPMDLLRDKEGCSVAVPTLMRRITSIVDTSMQAHTYRMRHMVAMAALRSYLTLYRTSICSVTNTLQNVSL